ncbi:MAG: GIN domain-containing protein [Muribaculaceae bacterium]
MRKYISMLLALLLTSSVCATAANTKVVASGKIVSKEIKGIAGFKEIQTNSSVSVIYHNAADTRIVVSASDNVIPYIEVVKKGSRLEVGLKKGVNVRVKNSRADLKVNVYAPEVTAFSVNGSGGIRIATDLKADRLALGVSGSGDIDAYNLSAGEVALGVTGSGDIEVRNVSGKKIAIGVTGSGDIECKAVSGDVVALGVTGSGDVKVSSVATDELACGVSGSGDIVVAAGTVGSANYGVTGSGDIKASSVIATEANAVASGSGDISCRATKQLSTAAMGSGNIYYYGNPAKVIGKNKRVKARN